MSPQGRVNGIELTEIDEFTANVKIPTAEKKQTSAIVTCRLYPTK